MEWKEEEVRNSFHMHHTEQILKLRLPGRRMDACIAWHYEKNGNFSVRSAYKLAKATYVAENGGRQSSSSPPVRGSNRQ
jgi:hypothetical protein